MNKQELRYHLHNLDILKDEIKSLQEEIDEYKNMEIEYFMVSVVSDMPRAPHSTIQSKVEFCALNRVEYMNKLQQEIAYKYLILKAIQAVINRIDRHSTEWKVIQCRYFAGIGKCNKWNVIARELHQDETYIKNTENGTICKMLNEYIKRTK